MNESLVVICPTRGRPQNAVRLWEAFQATATHVPTSGLVLATDDDDRANTTRTLRTLNKPNKFYPQVVVNPRLRLVGTLNLVATEVADDYDVVGFMGDDHLPRTESWDCLVIEALNDMGGTGIVYGNDLFQGENLPTAVFMSSNIVRTLGYMAPPCLEHLYVDNSWLAWGKGIDRLRYLPDVVIEHLHPEAGKAERDASYDATNSNEQYQRDFAAWATYATGGLQEDIEKLKGLL